MPTQQQVADHLDLVGTDHVRKLRDAGKIPDPATATIDEIRVAYIRNIRGVATGRQSADGSVDPVKENALLAREKRKGQEIKNAQLRGELVSAEEAIAATAELISLSKQRLEMVAAKVAATAYAAKTPAKTEKAIYEGIREACSDLADFGERIRPKD